jgi:uncharacterized protein (TIGR02246 family)
VDELDARALADVEAIRRVKARYLRAVDDKDWDRLIDVFSDDARLEATRGVTEGGSAIAARLRANLDGLVTVHRVHQDEIDVTGDEALAVFAMDDIVIHPSPTEARVGIHGHGRYHDRFIRTAGGWRLAEMRLERLAVLPLPGGNGPVPVNDPASDAGESHASESDGLR